MPLNFPTTGLTAGVTTYTYSGNTWIWNGFAWDSVVTPDSVGLTAYVKTWNGQTGDVGFSNYVAGVTGTANQISVSGFTGSVTIGLSNNVNVVGNLSVGGNLTVSGGVTSTFSETVLIEDNFITLNSNVTGGSPSENAGIEVSRGASANVQVRWNESTDRWQFTNDGTSYWNLPTSVVNSWNGQTGDVGFSNYVSSFGGLTGTVGAGLTSTQVLFWNANTVTGSNNFTFDGTDVVTLADTGHYSGRLLGPVLVAVKNTSGGTLTKGTPVYATGSVGNSGIVEVAGCSASDSSKMPAIGLLDDTLIDQAEGHAVVFGNLRGVATDGYTINGTVFVAPNGGLTGTKPTGANDLIQNIGRVIRVHASSGDILVSAIGRSNDVPNIVQVRSYLQMPDGTTASSLVKSWNGQTGAVTYSTPLATSSVTGVASFNSTYFTVAAGAVSLASAFQVTGDTVSAGTAITTSRSGNTVTVNNNGVISVNGSTGAVVSIAVTGANTFTGLQTMNAGITANNLYVSQGVTFNSTSVHTGLATFNAGITANNLYVSQGATFASRASFPAGITGRGFVAGFTGYHGPSAGALLRIQTGPPSLVNSPRIQIDGTAGGDISLFTSSGTVSIRDGSSLPGSGNGGTITIFSGNGVDTSYTSTISTGTVNANRTYTLPDLTGTLAVVNATQTFSSLQSFTAGITTNNLWVTNGATFAARSSFNSGLSASNLWVTNGATFADSIASTASITANSLWVTNGVTFASTSVHTGLATFNAGVTANNLWVTNGVTFAGTVSSDTGYRVSSTAFNAQSGTAYTLATADNGEIITMNNSAVSNITVPAGLPIGFNTMIIQLGTGQVGFTAASGVTLNSYASGLKISGQHGAATVISYATNVYNISGTLSV